MNRVPGVGFRVTLAVIFLCSVGGVRRLQAQTPATTPPAQAPAKAPEAEEIR